MFDKLPTLYFGCRSPHPAVIAGGAAAALAAWNFYAGSASAESLGLPPSKEEAVATAKDTTAKTIDAIEGKGRPLALNKKDITAWTLKDVEQYNHDSKRVGSHGVRCLSGDVDCSNAVVHLCLPGSRGG